MTCVLPQLADSATRTRTPGHMQLLKNASLRSDSRAHAPVCTETIPLCITAHFPSRPNALFAHMLHQDAAKNPRSASYTEVSSTHTHKTKTQHAVHRIAHINAAHVPNVATWVSLCPQELPRLRTETFALERQHVFDHTATINFHARAPNFSTC